MDIIEIDGKPAAKRGKWSGSKRVLRCRQCSARRVMPHDQQKHICQCGGEYLDILTQFMDRGELLDAGVPVKEIRSFVLQQLQALSFA